MAKRSSKLKGSPIMHDEEDFQAENDMRTLIEAEKIKKDSKRLKKAMNKAREQRDALSQVVSNTKKES